MPNTDVLESSEEEKGNNSEPEICNTAKRMKHWLGDNERISLAYNTLVSFMIPGPLGIKKVTFCFLWFINPFFVGYLKQQNIFRL